MQDLLPFPVASGGSSFYIFNFLGANVSVPWTSYCIVLQFPGKFGLLFQKFSRLISSLIAPFLGYRVKIDLLIEIF